VVGAKGFRLFPAEIQETGGKQVALGSSANSITLKQRSRREGLWAFPAEIRERGGKPVALGS